VLAYLILPMRRGSEGKAPASSTGSSSSFRWPPAGYPIIEQQYFNTRMAYVGPVSVTDQTFAILMIVVVLEAPGAPSARSCR
jgi:hypothetical protein